MGQRQEADEVRCRVGKRKGGKKVEAVSESQNLPVCLTWRRTAAAAAVVSPRCSRSTLLVAELAAIQRTCSVLRLKVRRCGFRREFVRDCLGGRRSVVFHSDHNFGKLRGGVCGSAAPKSHLSSAGESG